MHGRYGGVMSHGQFIKIGLRGIAVLAFLAVIWVLNKAPKTEGLADRKAVEKEHLAISPPTYVRPTDDRRVAYKLGSAVVQQSFDSNMASIDVIKHYDEQLLDNGWREMKKYGLQGKVYCKGKYRAEVTSRAHLPGYIFSVSWFAINKTCP